MKNFSILVQQLIGIGLVCIGLASVASAQQSPSVVELAAPVFVDGNRISNPALSDKHIPSTTPEFITERYPSGEIYIEREVVEDADGNFVAHGVWRRFDLQGGIVSEGRFNRNRRVGLWRIRYQAKAMPLLETSPYRDFDAPFTSEANFENGLLHGSWLIRDGQQRKVSEIQFQDGVREGTATWYYPQGSTLLQAAYRRGLVHGEVCELDSAGNVVTNESYQDGHTFGPRVEFYADGKSKKSEGAYRYAPLMVKTPDDFATCTLATFERHGTDVKHGLFKAWHANGQLAQEGEYRSGVPTGDVSYFFPTGQPEGKGIYLNGKQHGQWTWWYESGQKAIMGQYDHGKAVGNWWWWKESGQVAHRANLSGRPRQDQPTVPNSQGQEDRTATGPALDTNRLR